MISKDVASIIAKYNTPTPIYLLSGNFHFKKYLAFNDIDEYIRYLFDNRHSEQFSWLLVWHQDSYSRIWYSDSDTVKIRIDYSYIKNDPTYNDYEQFKQQFKNKIELLDVDYYKK